MIIVAFSSLLTTAALAQAPLAERTIGVGLGTSLEGLEAGSNWPLIDRYSLRFQLSDRVALEPEVVVQASGASQEDVSTVRDLQLGLGAGARWYAASRDTAHLVGMAGIQVERSTSTAEVGEREDQNTVTALTGLVGLGVEWTPSPTWAVSLDARQPLLSWASATTETNGETQSEYSQWSTGLRLQPHVSLMAHLFY